ncbi:MAG: YdcF family protein [Pseudomonadota bacterium]
MEYYLLLALKALVLPPLPLLILAAAGLVVARARPRLGWSLTLIGLAGLWILSTPWISRSLLATLEPPPHALADGARGAGAIVILGGGTNFDAPEYAGDTPNCWALERARYGARLHRATGLPLLVAGGLGHLGTHAEAEALKVLLEQDFQVPVRWVEGASANTFQNAANAASLLKPAGITRVLLVTHAAHMPRARLAFEAAGLAVVPAATGYATREPVRWLEWVPRASALTESRAFFHEALGIAWYRIKLALP